jgi:GGDEF domain-containing protein
VGINGDNIRTVTDRLQKSLQAYNAKRECNYNLSMSLGIARFDPEKPSSMDELITKADQSMYKQKRQKQASQKKPLSVIRPEISIN